MWEFGDFLVQSLSAHVGVGSTGLHNMPRHSTIPQDLLTSVGASSTTLAHYPQALRKLGLWHLITMRCEVAFVMCPNLNRLLF